MTAAVTVVMTAIGVTSAAAATSEDATVRARIGVTVATMRKLLFLLMRSLAIAQMA